MSRDTVLINRVGGIIVSAEYYFKHKPGDYHLSEGRNTMRCTVYTASLRQQRHLL